MTDERFMKEALAEARKALAEGEVPIGAVIVADGVIIVPEQELHAEATIHSGHADLLRCQSRSPRL